ncbi:DNA replication/repair protein RecF [Cognatishimia sp. F0-27]|uniref:DNA replication/repair protein RecF n=1 Tax=Cognatishimia sp. F0-27 TaxID=2816855 RepID=UPI001D0CBE18|nr:DNA replication/repair protein RecF [Cognatishimia sp. F0-27]MCC1493062.1 DNA replication/repair protein RecF [Cognatishimia sp. F0-27]
MHLTSLSLSHFRSHRLSRLEIDGRPVAVHGPNGAGKTNLIEAVSLFSPGRGLRRGSAQDMTRRPEAIGWKIDGLLHHAEGVSEISFASDKGAARRVQIDGKTASQIALGRIARVVWLVPTMDRLWIEGAEGRRRFLDRMTLSFFPDHAQAALDYEKAMRERNRLLKEQVRDPHWYRALEHQMARTGAVIVANRAEALERLLLAQAAAETAFPAADLALSTPDGPAPETAEALEHALKDGRATDLRAGRTLVGPHRTDLQGRFAAKGILASDCSTGEQKALLISLILANARALRDTIGTPPLVLLDEVAAHLDASRRAALYDEICALGAQAWMTGTGPELFAELGARAQQFIVTENAGISEVSAYMPEA